MKSVAVLALAAYALVLAGCSTVQPNVAPVEYEPSLVQHYKLGSGDRIRIIVYAQPDVSNTYTVDQGGYISVPLIGPVTARGKTTQALEAEIARKLQGGFLKDPDVSVEIDRYRPFFIMGEIGAGGQYSYVPGLTVQQAIAVAGGFSPRAVQSFIEVSRQQDGRIVILQLRLTDAVFPGDTITVKERLL